MQNANVLTFFQELLQRLFTKSPTFFKVWSIISGTLVLITGLPDFINMLGINGIHIPDLWNASVTNSVAWASRAALFMSILTSQSKPSAIDSETGKVIKNTDEKKLPFTAAREARSAEKHDVDVVTLNKADASQN